MPSILSQIVATLFLKTELLLLFFSYYQGQLMRQWTAKTTVIWLQLFSCEKLCSQHRSSILKKVRRKHHLEMINFLSVSSGDNNCIYVFYPPIPRNNEVYWGFLTLVQCTTVECRLIILAFSFNYVEFYVYYLYCKQDIVNVLILMCLFTDFFILAKVLC